mmetsp:Transcript_33865/g.108236  ORF Transcript_33865/g.108236 Transcript_33865/m.108236 type:complete len:383 (+) Transcript_33865:451-1599(+)
MLRSKGVATVADGGRNASRALRSRRARSPSSASATPRRHARNDASSRARSSSGVVVSSHAGRRGTGNDANGDDDSNSKDDDDSAAAKDAAAPSSRGGALTAFTTTPVLLTSKASSWSYSSSRSVARSRNASTESPSSSCDSRGRPCEEKGITGPTPADRFGSTVASRPLFFPLVTSNALRCAFGPGRPLRVRFTSGMVFLLVQAGSGMNPLWWCSVLPLGGGASRQTSNSICAHAPSEVAQEQTRDAFAPLRALHVVCFEEGFALVEEVEGAGLVSSSTVAILVLDDAPHRALAVFFVDLSREVRFFIVLGEGVHLRGELLAHEDDDGVGVPHERLDELADRRLARPRRRPHGLKGHVADEDERRYRVRHFRHGVLELPSSS